MSEPLVAEVVRGSVVESVHVLDAVAVDEAGAIVAEAGDSSKVAAFRSSAKPLQAAVCLEQGWSPGGDESIAVACASHNGEPAHVEAVRKSLASSGATEDMLRCPPDFPLAIDAPREGRARIRHNCSGKHAAMLGACLARGWEPAAYLDPDSPLQRAIALRVEEAAGATPVVAVDGCGAPTFALSLHALARAFGASLTIGEGPRAAAAMRAHPFLVAGTGRVCTALLGQAHGVVVKVGAEGLVCAAYPGGSLAIKTRDGAARGRDPALVMALTALGARVDAEGMEPFAAPPVLGGGEPVGMVRVRGEFGPS